MAKDTLETQIALMRARVKQHQDEMTALVRTQRADPKRQEELQGQINAQRDNRDKYDTELNKLLEEQRKQQVAERQRLAREEYNKKQAQQKAVIDNAPPIAAGAPSREEIFIKRLRESMKGLFFLMQPLENVDAGAHAPMQEFMVTQMKKLRADTMKYLQDLDATNTAAAPVGKAMGDIAPALDALKQTYDRLATARGDQKGIRETIKKIIDATPNITIRMEEHGGVMVPIIRPQDGTPNATRAAQLLADLLALYQVEILRPERGLGHVLYTKRYSEQEQQDQRRPDRGLDLKDIMEWYPELRQMIDTKSAEEFLRRNTASLKETGEMLRGMGGAEAFAAESLERDVEALHFIVNGEHQPASIIVMGRTPSP